MWSELVIVVIGLNSVTKSEICNAGISLREVGLDVSLTRKSDVKCTWPKHCCEKTDSIFVRPSCCFHFYFWIIIGGLFLLLVVLIPLICYCVYISNRAENTIVVQSVRPYPGFYDRPPIRPQVMDPRYRSPYESVPVQQGWALSPRPSPGQPFYGHPGAIGQTPPNAITPIN